MARLPGHGFRQAGPLRKTLQTRAEASNRLRSNGHRESHPYPRDDLTLRGTQVRSESVVSSGTQIRAQHGVVRALLAARNHKTSIPTRSPSLGWQL
jgi:hypothetical protein